jgi:hypothetical protein
MWLEAIHGDPLVPTPHVTITKSIAHPSEAVIPSPFAYSVAPGYPRSIHIPSIAAEGFIQQVDLDDHGRITVPTNIHVAGWYIRSALPGDPGLSILDGHLSGAYSEGIFLRLATLKQDDTFTIEKGDLSHLTFKVKKVMTVGLADADAALLSRDTTIGSQLNIITCEGSYDHTTHTYDKRVIVVSEKI